MDRHVDHMRYTGLAQQTIVLACRVSRQYRLDNTETVMMKAIGRHSRVNGQVCIED